MKFLLTLILIFNSLLVHSQPIEFVITAAPGGAGEILARRLEKEIESNSNLKIAVITKPGASHNIGYQYIHQSKKPTIFVSDISLVRNKNLPGYPDGIATEVDPLVYIGGFYTVLMVNSKSPIKTYNDFLKVAKDREIRIGHGGIGSFSHEAAVEVCKNIDCLLVPYKSAPPGMMDLAGQTIDAYPFLSFGAKQLLQTDGNFIGIRDIDFKHWVMLFSKNLNDSDKATIINILSNKDRTFFESLGVTYARKNARDLWAQTLKEK